MLLRYFVNFYDMEIIEEEAFLAWKEDITQEFPGKGKALFQVQNLTACRDTRESCNAVITACRSLSSSVLISGLKARKGRINSFTCPPIRLA